MFLFIFVGFFIFNAAEEKLTTTTEGEVCDLDSSCNSSFTAELPIEKSNISKKLKYNISDGIIYNNETLDIFSLNGTNLTTVELDLRNKNNKSIGNESKSTNTKYRIQIKERCSCDLTKGSCDINCCCDRDCLVVNRDIFKKCIKTTHTEADKMCISKILNSPLLCVVKDNLYSRHFYPQHQTAVEASNVDKLMKNREVYGWSYPFLSENEHIFHNFKEYELNSFVWIFKDADTKTFRLPKTTMISRDCSNTEAMKFLNDFEDTCIYRIREISIAECESNNSIFNALTYFSNFSFVMNPNFFNNSNDCRNHCINVIPFICASDDFASCLKANVSKITPIYFSNTSTCHQAVTSVHYEIFHNGTEGILSVNVYLQFANITFHSKLLWAVSFKLTYKWANQNEAFELSGYPGYIAEKPIITSHKIFQNSKENKTYASLKMSHNHKNWLTIFRTNNDGSCAKMRRKNILFQENLYAHCWISVPEIKSAENCESFQNEIFEIMFGVNFNLSNVYVSTYGDPDLGDKLKWAPIATDFPSNVMNESCYGIITSIKMIILHSAIGEHDNPQQVIMGLKVSGTSLYRNVKYHHVLITFGVNFYDVTNPPLRIFAEPPTYEVKLPTDFFYPFFSKCSPVLGSKTILSVLMFFLYSFY